MLELENPTRIMLDLDGVVSDYTKRFLEVADELYGIFDKVGRISSVSSWHFHDAGIGITEEQEEEIFRETQNKENFWENLDSLLTDADREILRQFLADPKYEIYAITARYPTRGRSILVQTSRWLLKQVGPGISVIPAEKKAEVCQVLGIKVALEDSPVYSKELKQGGVEVVLVDRPYNRETDSLPRVESVREFFELLKNGGIPGREHGQ
ncbi:MAG: 5' nucleotidase, NT5C type [Promethearchaeota archaeon]